MRILKKILKLFTPKKPIPKKGDQWFIGIKYRSKNIFNLKGLVFIKAPKGRYWADPFVIEHEGKHYLFYEDYDYIKAVIGVAELKGLRLLNPRTVIEEKQHMSFPAVFKHDGQIYMTPERCRAKKLYIYKATRFPDVWEKYALVARGKFDDPIVRKVKSGFEIWTTEGGNNLRVFKSSNLKGPWILIKKSEEDFARSAGYFIGNLRPVQDLRKTYGGAIKFLDRKKVVKTINPNWGKNLNGTHTFNVTDKYIVIDGRRPYAKRIDK